MKTFEQVINEGHQFLRSIGKNDKVVDYEKTFADLKAGDWLFYTSSNSHITSYAVLLNKDFLDLIKKINDGHYGGLEELSLMTVPNEDCLHAKSFIEETFRYYGVYYANLDDFENAIPKDASITVHVSGELIYRCTIDTFIKKYIKRK